MSAVPSLVETYMYVRESEVQSRKRTSKADESKMETTSKHSEEELLYAEINDMNATRACCGTKRCGTASRHGKATMRP